MEKSILAILFLILHVAFGIELEAVIVLSDKSLYSSSEIFSILDETYVEDKLNVSINFHVVKIY